MRTEIRLSNVFRRRYKERISGKPKLVGEFKEALSQFTIDRSAAWLHDHQLNDAMQHYRAFAINADYRVIYRWKEPNEAILLDIGTHDDVYRR